MKGQQAAVQLLVVLAQLPGYAPDPKVRSRSLRNMNVGLSRVSKYLHSCAAAGGAGTAARICTRS
jgi:hypothetical protein